MRTNLNLKWFLGIMLISLSSMVLGQENVKPNLADQLHKEYKDKGIEQSLKSYEKLNTDKSYNGFEEPLNILGYTLMLEDQDLDAAKVVFEAQIKEYSDEANPYDSYADLLLEMGNKEEAKKNLLKSIALTENSKEDLDVEIFRASKTKLAKIENKHKKFEFMKGDYNVAVSNYNDDKVINENTFRSSSSYDESGNILTINYYNLGNSPVGKRIVVYDALEDTYDMAFINPTDPFGINISHMKVKDLGNNKVELMESFVDRNGKSHSVRHEVMKNSNNSIEWVVYQQEDGSDKWEKATVQNYNKSE
ncbi:hypothetical protein BC962_1867 [Gillisia mitskevichiae]|uniref:Tetratricopeptide repeat protein n=1 Tax=Gillisia mitskevichiae TaxID=270921 RepID=A0A495PSL7_9FLAO|nr:tetratricopeptide repeat protein [Gillisia mitskevichiae]RKS53614.1 hypothetical protein BC962_1867 [Gillisia mitskevichiae]